MAKITREAFVYLEPRGDGKDFAQCWTCAFMTSGKCLLFRGDNRVHYNDSCGLYVPAGEKDPFLPIATVTKAEAGYIKGSVRCENCSYGGAKCGLYKTLNKTLPQLFDLNETIESKACCNAYTRGKVNINAAISKAMGD